MGGRLRRDRRRARLRGHRGIRRPHPLPRPGKRRRGRGAGRVDPCVPRWKARALSGVPRPRTRSCAPRAGELSDSRWRASPATLVKLLAGLWIFGTGEAMLVASELGNSPWTVLAEGVEVQTPLSIGVA